MTSASPIAASETTLLNVATPLLRARWRIAFWMLLFGISMFGVTRFKPLVYVATASFATQGGEGRRSGGSGLASQIAGAAASGDQLFSPVFYSELLRAPVILRSVAKETFAVPELGGAQKSFAGLFNLSGPSRAALEEREISLLKSMIGTDVSMTTSVVELSVTTRWPSLSGQIAQNLLKHVNEFNSRIRQGQASTERAFIEARLQTAGAELRAAEDRLQFFLAGNRDIAGSPAATFEKDRLQRNLSLRQQVFTQLTTSLEDARIREVRDTPATIIIEPPTVSTLPASRGGVRALGIGLLLGAAFGIFLSFTKHAVATNARTGDPSTQEFLGVWGEVKADLFSPYLWLKARLTRA